jgi:hypothetical protein
MSAIRGSAHYEGLLPFEPSDEPPPIRSTILENAPLNGQPSLRKRASRAPSRFLTIFCVGVGTTLAWQSYSDAAREMIANSYPQLGWIAPRPLPTAQNASGMIGLATPPTPSPDQQQLNAMSLDAMRPSVDRIAVGHELILRSIDQTAVGHAQITRSLDQIAAGQGQMTHSVDQTTTSIAQAASAKASDIRVESPAVEASLQPTLGLDTKPTEARPPETLSEREKQLSAASGNDASCLPSASAAVQHHPEGWPSWTLKAPGHEGTICWYASARPRARDHRSEVMPRRGLVGTTENGFSAPPAIYAPPTLSPGPALAYSRAPWLSAPPTRSYSRPPE